MDLNMIVCWLLLNHKSCIIDASDLTNWMISWASTSKWFLIIKKAWKLNELTIATISASINKNIILDFSE